MIQSILSRKAIPVYGDGMNVRDWLYGCDHVETLWLVLNQVPVGETYNIGALNEMTNLHLVQ